MKNISFKLLAVLLNSFLCTYFFIKKIKCLLNYDSFSGCLSLGELGYPKSYNYHLIEGSYYFIFSISIFIYLILNYKNKEIIFYLSIINILFIIIDFLYKNPYYH